MEKSSFLYLLFKLKQNLLFSFKICRKTLIYEDKLKKKKILQ